MSFKANSQVLGECQCTAIAWPADMGGEAV